MTAINEEIIIDTILLAKNKFRGQSISLDSLCRKYNIDISNREVHGALKDAKLDKLLYLLNQPNYTTGNLNLIADIKNADINNLAGLVTTQIKDAKLGL